MTGAPPPQAWILGANQPPERFYRGGRRIAAFRNEPVRGTHVPEDWVGSVTSLFGEEKVGLTVLAHGAAPQSRTAVEDGMVLEAGTVLADAIRADPVGWLGVEHVAVFGADPSLLVKLLDAGQRLPVHAHPSVPWAGEHLGLTHGKTEAWVFLKPATVWLGFTRTVAQAEVAAWVAQQDVEGMLAAMHRLEARTGDAIFVPAGTPHAIGEGAFIVEVQEPTDLSILMEWRDFDIDGSRDGHLGLGFDVALSALERGAMTAAEVEGLRSSTAADAGALLPDAAEFFRVERHRSDAALDAGFSVVVVVNGHGVLTFEAGKALAVTRGSTVLVPYAAGRWTVSEAHGLELLRCRPPAC